MSVWPVLVREIRETARQPATYRARLISAAVVLVAGAVYGIQVGNFGPGQGAEVFTWLHLTVFISTWILVPFMAADCLSQEQREGTLGLLFLTPLRALDIVLAKLSVHGLRGATLWLAAVPVFVIPVIIGGVSWQQAVVALMFNLSALMLSLAAAIVSSAWSKRWAQSVICSIGLGAVLFVAWCYLFGLILTVSVAWLMRGGGSQFRLTSLADSLTIPFICLTNWSADVFTVRSGVLGGSLSPAILFLLLSLTGVVLSTFLLLLCCVVAARATRHSWQEMPPSELRVAVERRFTTPIVGQDLLKRWLRRTLNRNPVGWLERRSWSGRLIMFGWLAIVIGVFSGLIPQVQFWRFNMRRYDIDLIDVLLAHPLLVSMAAAAAGSFRRERESGVLELLLVSPLDASTIVFGRIRGLYAQFLPSVVLILVGWIFLVTLWPDSATDQLWPVVRFAALSLAIPCLGLYASLRTRNFISAFLLAVVLGWGVPWLTSVVWGLVCFGLDLGIRRGMVPMSISLLPAMAALVLGGTAVQLMIRRLEQRRFEFNREVT